MRVPREHMATTSFYEETLQGRGQAFLCSSKFSQESALWNTLVLPAVSVDLKWLEVPSMIKQMHQCRADPKSRLESKGRDLARLDMMALIMIGQLSNVLGGATPRRERCAACWSHYCSSNFDCQLPQCVFRDDLHFVDTPSPSLSRAARAGVSPSQQGAGSARGTSDGPLPGNNGDKHCFI